MDVDAQPLEEKAEKEMKPGVSAIKRPKKFSWALGLGLWLAAGVLATAQAASAAASSPARAGSADLPPPLEVHGLKMYVTEEGRLRDEIYAETAYFYEPLRIAKLRRIHANLYDRATGEKDTLDAPQGYLYLKDFEGNEAIGPDNPFYKAIGGKKANIVLLTSGSRTIRDLPEKIVRHRNDIDLIGHLGRKVVYRRYDGTVVSCLRVYRDALNRRLYGIGECEARNPQPKNRQVMIISGEIFTTNDQLTSGIQILGKGGRPPRFSFEPLEAEKRPKKRP